MISCREYRPSLVSHEPDSWYSHNLIDNRILSYLISQKQLSKMCDKSDCFDHDYHSKLTQTSRVRRECISVCARTWDAVCSNLRMWAEVVAKCIDMGMIMIWLCHFPLRKRPSRVRLLNIKFESCYFRTKIFTHRNHNQNPALHKQC